MNGLRVTGYGVLRLLIVSILCFTLTGCGAQWKRKFIRRHEETKPESVFVYEPKEYQSEPNADLYNRSFIFWKSWMGEMEHSLGANKKADVRSFQEAIKDMEEMESCLKEEKAAEMGGYRQKLAEYMEYYKSKDMEIIGAGHMRDDLHRLEVKVDKIFRPSRVEKDIKN